ncbi:MAG: HEAT repeat domain-containing protein [Gemmatimonadota bacterium]|nr:HEAT repeat domain-containing protein [Gemmatimonadota bacterium]
MSSAASQTRAIPNALKPERDGPPFPPAPAEELARLFVRAIRAHQLYLPNNPIYKGAIDGLRAGFAPIWANAEELTLTVTETDFRWCGHVILEEPAKSADSLPWLFFKDGIREIQFLPGFETEELPTLLDIMQRIRKASPEEEDLLTLLWEGDFSLLKYRYVDLGLEAAAPLADGLDAKPPERVDAEQIRQEVEASKASGVIDIADFDATLYFLDEAEIEYLRGEVKREYDADLRQNVLAILFDIFEQQASPAVRTEICEILENLILHLLSAGRFRNVGYLLREANQVANRVGDLAPESRARLTALPQRLSTPEALGQLLQALDDAAELPPQQELAELFEQLQPGALSPALSWLNRIQNARLKVMLEQSIGRLAASNITELIRLIGSPDRAVAAEAMRRSGALKTAAAVGPLGKVLNDADADLRQIAVQALTEIGSAGALQALERAIEDDSRDVRVAAARALAARSYRAALPRIESVIKGRGVREADLTEKMAFFELYGSLCGEAGVEYLDNLLNGKGFLGRREDAELRACAAMALGRIGTATSSSALRKAAQEKDVVVRNAVTKALRGGAA